MEAMKLVGPDERVGLAPSAAKAGTYFRLITYGLKAVPFKNPGFSAAGKPSPSITGAYLLLKLRWAEYLFDPVYQRAAGCGIGWKGDALRAARRSGKGVKAFEGDGL
jgi:hypothetical protein